MEVKQIGNLTENAKRENPNRRRVYDSNGLSPTLTSGMGEGGNLQPFTIVAMRGRNPDNPSNRIAGSPTEQRLEPNSQGICNTLTSVQKDNLLLEVKYNFKLQSGAVAIIDAVTEEIVCVYRIRKLTPLECWRLMGFTDEDFHKAERVNSNSQLYKQAGNSIVKNVLMAIFNQML